MKHSINGKTFDEIFGQRGEEVKVEDMVSGEIYLWDDSASPVLSVFNKMENNVYHTKFDMANDGSTFPGWPWFVGYKMECAEFFTATPDQISLLNSCMNESTNN